MGNDDLMGSIGVTGATYAPQNTTLCQGQLISIAQNSALFAVIGWTFGQGGYTAFGVPDLRGSLPVGTGPRPGSEVPNARGDVRSPVVEAVWGNTRPARAANGERVAESSESGAYGVALNWAMCLYGEFPERDNGPVWSPQRPQQPPWY